MERWLQVSLTSSRFLIRCLTFPSHDLFYHVTKAGVQELYIAVARQRVTVHYRCDNTDLCSRTQTFKDGNLKKVAATHINISIVPCGP